MNEVILDINGMIDHHGWQRSYIRYFLDRNKGKAVRCRINSPGGSVDQALAISKLFETHGNVTVEFVGFCASAATFMAFGAKSIEMNADSLWLCHKCTVPVSLYGNLNEEQLDATIKELERIKKNEEVINLVIAKKYLSKCSAKGKTLQDVFDLLKQEKWMDAETVLEWGFIDKIVKGEDTITEDYRNMLVENCVSMNLPSPLKDSKPVIVDNKEELADMTQGNDLVARFVSAVKAIFTPMPKSTEDNNPINNSTIMNKTFVMVNALLGVEGLAENNGKVELTIDQLQKICNALKEADDNKQSVTKATEALDAISPNIKGITGLENKIQAVAVVLNMVPKGVPAGNALPKDDKAEDFSETAKDPVNEFVKER